MPQATGEGNHRVSGVEERDGRDIDDPNTQKQPDDGPAMGSAGAMPSGSAMDHWATAMPNTDATKPETMPNTASTPLPGETTDREPV